jgi:hypothetical protein
LRPPRRAPSYTIRQESITRPESRALHRNAAS